MPVLIATPFATNGTKNDIPETTGAQPQNATMDEGFPAITQQPISTGGIPPERADFNGILYALSDNISHINKGLAYSFDTAFATKIGGYPLHAELLMADGTRVVSTIANNMNNPDVDLTGWRKGVSSSDVTDESGLSQQEINNRMLKARLIDLSYLSPPTDYDLTSILDSTLKLSQVFPIHVILPYGSFKITDSISTGTLGKGVILDLNGSTIYVDKRSEEDQKLNGIYAVLLYSTTDFPACIKNGVLTGERREQNLFNLQDIAIYNNKQTSLISMSSKYISIENTTLKHAYGQTTRFLNSNFVNVSNVTILDCGGRWYRSDGNDSFGDAFYIAGGKAGQEKIFAEFRNVNAVMKSSDQYPENEGLWTTPRYSRIGLTIEALNSVVRSKLEISMYNCEIHKCERLVHQELSLDTNLNVYDSSFSGCVIYGAYLTGVLDVFSKNTDYKLLQGNYNGSTGLLRQYSGTVKLNSEGGVLDGSGKGYPFGNGTTYATINKMTAVNLNIRFAEYSNNFIFNDCTFKYSTPSSNATWFSGGGSSSEFYNCTLDASSLSFATFENGIPAIMKGCKLIGLAISREANRSYNKENYTSNTLISDDTAIQSQFKGSSYAVKNTGGLLIREEMTLWGCDRNIGVNKIFYQKVLAKHSEFPASLVDDDLIDFAKKRSVFVLVVRANNSSKHYAINEIGSTNNTAYYAAVVKYNASSNTFTVVKPFVSSVASPTYAVSFDGLNVTSASASTTNFHIAAVSYDQLYSLPIVDDTLIL